MLVAMDDTSTMQLPRTRRRHAMSSQAGYVPASRREPRATTREIVWTCAAFLGLFLLAWLGSVVIQGL